MTQDNQTSFEEEVLSDRGDRIVNLLKAWEEAIDDHKVAQVGKLEKTRKDAKQAVMDVIPMDDQAHRWRVGPYVINVRPAAPPTDIGFRRTPKPQISLIPDHGG